MSTQCDVRMLHNNGHFCMKVPKGCFQRHLTIGAEKHIFFHLKSTTYYVLLETIDTYAMSRCFITPLVS